MNIEKTSKLVEEYLKNLNFDLNVERVFFYGSQYADPRPGRIKPQTSLTISQVILL